MNTTIEELIVAKGLTVDCFDELNEAVKALEENVERFERIHQNLVENMKRCEIFEEAYDYLLPITEHDITKMKWDIKEHEMQYARGIKYIVQKCFRNVEFDGHEYENYIKSQEKFDARKIMFHLFEEYGADEDYLSLVDIQNNVINSLPKQDGSYWGDKITCPEELVKSNKKGLKFLTSQHKNISSIIKFADIVIGNMKPSECVRYVVPEGGKAYGGNIKTLNHYKNGSVVINFNSLEDCKKYGEAIFTDPKELMKTIFNEATNASN
jgi:hypothetical protein